jgi:hypothetical protein
MENKTFSDLVSPSVNVAVLKELLRKMPVQVKFKENFEKYLESKKILQTKECSAFVLGVAFGEFVNKNVDPNSDEDMKDYYVSRAILSNTDKLPLIIRK